MTTRTIPLKFANPTSPALQPVGDPYYKADEYWYKSPDGTWQKQVPTRTCSTGWVFGTQGSDWKSPATCTGTDSYVTDVSSLCEEGWVPQKTEVQRFLCGVSSNSGALCNTYSDWPDSEGPASTYFNLVSDNNLYCVPPAPIPLVEEFPTPIPLVEEFPTPIPLVEEFPAPIPLVEEFPAPIPLIEEEFPAPIPLVEEFPAPIPLVEEEEDSAPSSAAMIGLYIGIGIGVLLILIVIIMIIVKISKKKPQYPIQYARVPQQ